MNNNLKYWLVIDSWNLIESFTTESISPYSFYESRRFGNTLNRYVTKGGETINHLILTLFEPANDYAIEISSDLLEIKLLETIDKKKTIFTYPKTIYYRKDKVKFRFSSKELMIGLIAESKILFEVKCVEKYMNSFYIENKATKKIDKNFTSNFLFERDSYLKYDNLLNFIKGSIIAYAYGQLTSMDSNQQNLLISITDLKNTFAGLNTNVMISDDPISDLSSLQKIALSKKEYYKQNLESTNLFDILSQVFNETVKLASMRSAVLHKQKTPNYLTELKDLQNTKEKLQKKLFKIETAFQIDKIHIELDLIKQTEVENGRNKGKSRLYFKKNTPEYTRKQEIKEIINAFEDENKEYKELKKEVIELEERISNYRFGSTEYDSTLGALFVRLSDGANDLMKKINKLNNTKSITFSDIKILNNKISFTPSRFNNEEVIYLNIVINYILANPSQGTRVISEIDILNVVTETAKIYIEISSRESEVKTKILNVLRQYWSYKNNKTDTFVIPIDLPILQAIMSFYIKAQGFDQIERFMLNRKYKHKEFALALWGAFVGYAAIPKTLSTIIFQNNNSLINDYIDDYIFENLHNIKDNGLIT